MSSLTTASAGEPELSSSSAVGVVRKVKTAFLFYQADQLSHIRAELGPTASMGEAMTTLAARWRNMSDEEKACYVQQEQRDRERFERESAEADARAAATQEARRRQYTVDDLESSGGGGGGDDEALAGAEDYHQQRGARQKIQAERDRAAALRQQRQAAATSNLTAEELEDRKQWQEERRRETEQRRKQRQASEQAVAKQHHKLDKEETKKAAQRLEYLFAQSSIFAKLSGGQRGALPTAQEETSSAPSSPAPAAKRKPGRPPKNGAASTAASSKPSVHHLHSQESNNDEEELDEEMQEEEAEQAHIFLNKQPSCIKSGMLKPYQLEALNWMIHLSEKGLNGILADEMGLGKTVQSIAIMAYYYEYRRIQGPHLVCVPKSTLSNWMNELKRWCPVLRAIKFHGSREEREWMVDNYFTSRAAAHDGRRPDKPQILDESGEYVDDNTDNPRPWDVCVTTYEVANAERKTLQKFAWKYLVIDEAHRLKNDVSMFSKTVRSFRTANRLLLTGTPLQNNLHELWALLNFLLPDIFSSAEQFDEWFDLEIDDEEAKKNMISQLHKILRPFMLRRLKADVAKGLPPKTETILMVGMSKMQKQLYKKLLLRDLDSITGKAAGKNRTAILNIVMQLRKCCGHPYLFEGMEDRTLDPLGEHLVENCGKLSMVDKLLKRLKERGHRVLIFTQMARILDILEDFMVMRGFQYCRIDGNTNYEDREGAIEEFNREGSEKFCFLLSTRAGGLGLNLQTADVVILYDSDWNPQVDLQAQDRAHRLGQKRPVSVFRLVSENTIEEKIVERAQQKLKLDAMVVQQGRLKEKDKLSKEEIMAAVRFGADTIFRSDESTITDDDIDIILERGKAKTKELAEKIQKADKGNLLDFRLDGGIATQTYEGIDYSDKDLRDHLRMLAANSMGKRERRPPPTSYNPIIHSKKSMVVNNRRIKLPKSLRLPQMEDHHFYNRERLLELGRLEFETYAALREAGHLPPRDVIDRQRTLLPPELAQEKLELLDEGFGTWSRSQYFHFVKACAKFGRDDIASIAADMDMPEEAVAPYSEAFWNYGPTELKNEWDRVVGNIERGEKKLAKQKKLTTLLAKFVGTFDNPRDEMVFANKGTTFFALEQDRALLCAVDKHGYGNWDSVREEIRTDSRLRFQHTVLGMTVQSIGKRCDYRMRQMEKELEAREKALKNKRPPSAIAAQKAIDAIKEMEFWDMRSREAQLAGEEPPRLAELSHDARIVMEERLKERAVAIARLREVEVQVQRCLAVAEETKQSIYRGDQYVNYSSITLKAGGPASSNEEEKSGPSVQDEVDIEASINPLVLTVQPCRQCENCTNSNTKICVKRLEKRQQLIADHQARLRDRGKGKSKKRKAAEISTVKKAAVEPTPAPAPTPKPIPPPKKKLMMKKPDGQLKPRVTSQGNKRMTIPPDLFPEFCRRISAAGTGERMKLINQFVEDHPTISVRQVTLKLGEITTRDRPECVPEPPPKKGGRAFMFYLRPRFYKFLPEGERPTEWEYYAEMDEAKWQEEQIQKKGDNSENAVSPKSATNSNANASVMDESRVENEHDDTEDEHDEQG